MFSTPIGHRELTLTFKATDGVDVRIHRNDFFRLPVAPSVKNNAIALVTMPSLQNFRRCVDDINRYQWVLARQLSNDGNPSESNAFIPLPRDRVRAERLAETIAVRQVVVEFWEYEFDRETSQLLLKRKAFDQIDGPTPADLR